MESDSEPSADNFDELELAQRFEVVVPEEEKEQFQEQTQGIIEPLIGHKMMLKKRQKKKGVAGAQAKAPKEEAKEQHSKVPKQYKNIMNDLSNMN